MSYQNIPDELKKIKAWCCYGGDKAPRSALDGGFAKSNAPATWASFDEAVKAVRDYGFDGIGFFFSPPYFGVDIDKVSEAIDLYDAESEEENIVSEFIYSLKSYTEYSVSGNGIHIICKGKLPGNRNRHKNVEMYQNGRYFIMTGDCASEYMDIKDCTETIKPLYKKYIEPIVTDYSKLNPKYSALLEGDISGYASHSEADLAFVGFLAEQNAWDRNAVDKAFRESKLYRAKWDTLRGGSTYGERTLDKVFAGHEILERQKDYTWDDTGNAARFKDMFGDKLRYNYSNDAWDVYDGKRWRQDPADHIKTLADSMVKAMRKEAASVTDPDVKKAFDSFIKKTGSHHGKRNFLAETQHLLPIINAKYNLKDYEINTEAGLIDLDTGENLGHKRGHMVSKIAPYTGADESAECPTWGRFLYDTFGGDVELLEYIQKAIGYSLSADITEQCIFILHGAGRNGKSVFLDILAHLLGDYALNTAPETIMVRQNSGISSDLARLKDARVVITSENNEGVRFNEGLIKRLTGGDRIVARHLYGNEFEYKPKFKLWLSTNNKPIVRGTDEGIWRRLPLIPFTRIVPLDEVDPNLTQKLKAEGDAIFRWALRGFKRWRTERLGMPKAVAKAMNKYRCEMDSVAAFVEDRCIVHSSGSRAKTSSADLYAEYRDWARESGEYLFSKTKFGIEMRKKFSRIVSGRAYYLGISLKSANYFRKNEGRNEYY